jgi:(S)-mandelate dehydrogenase
MRELMRLNQIRQAYTIEDLRLAAKNRLPRGVFDFYDGAAEDEDTLKNNLLAFKTQRWRPHVLRDVSQVDPSGSIFDVGIGLPLAIGPTGGAGFGHPMADLALAKAAAQFNIPYCLSTSATTSIETIAEHASGRLWFQAYVLSDQVHFWKLQERVLSAGYEALMITVDLAVGGKRVKDHHNHFSLPFRLSDRNLMDMLSRPRWLLGMMKHGFPVMENMVGASALKASPMKSLSGLGSSVGKNYDPSFDFERLKEVRQRWPKKLIVKGVQRGDDAAKLVDLGVDLIVVSNHGGRQLDGAQASLEVLPEVLASVAGRVPVWVDGGIRHGGDIAKALSLGASGALSGRATLYGAVAAGHEGAHQALSILSDEFLRTMQLCGVCRVKDFQRDLLQKQI